MECCSLNQRLLRKAKIWCQIPAAVKNRNVSNIKQKTTWHSLPWSLCISHPPSSECLTHLPFSSPSGRATLMLCCSPTQICSPLAASASSGYLPGWSNSAFLLRSLPFFPVVSSPLLWSLPPAEAWFLSLLFLPNKICDFQGTLM